MPKVVKHMSVLWHNYRDKINLFFLTMSALQYTHAIKLNMNEHQT